jgi:antitoxin (DNA-binding transcriptional repressor) of toxin-antitoxin stability system
MKTVEIEEFEANLDRYFAEIQTEAIVITRKGKPCAVLHGVADDVETAELAHSAEFWAMIEQRREEPTVSWEEAKKDLA